MSDNSNTPKTPEAVAWDAFLACYPAALDVATLDQVPLLDRLREAHAAGWRGFESTVRMQMAIDRLREEAIEP